MRTPLPFLLVLPLGGLAVQMPVQAQGLPAYVARHDWPAAMSPADFKRIAVGDFTGDQHASAMILSNGQLAFNLAPAVHDYVQALTMPGGCTLNDIATLEPATVGAQATVLGVGSFGLVEATYDLTLPDPDLTLITHSTGTGWMGASRVVARRQNATTVVVVGVSASRRILTVGTITNGVFSQVASKVYLADIQDIDLLYWDSATDLRIAMLFGQNLRILNQGTGQIVQLNGTSVGGDLAVLHDSATPTAERLGWARPKVGGGWELAVAAHNATTAVAPLSVTLAGIGSTDQFDLCGIAGGDATGDGYADVVVSQRTTSEVIVIERSGSGLPNQSNQIALVLSPPASAPQPGLSAVPAFADIDHDGDADVFAAHEQTPDRTMLFGGLRELLDPTATPQTPAITDLRYCARDSEGDLGRPTMDIVLNVSSPSYAWVEVVLWLEMGPNNGIEHDSLHWEVFGVPQQMTQGYARLRIDPVPASTQLENDAWLVGTMQTHVWAEIRFANSQGVFISPSYLFGMTMSDSANPMNTLGNVAPGPAWVAYLAASGSTLHNVLRNPRGEDPPPPAPTGRQFGGATIFPPFLPEPTAPPKPPKKSNLKLSQVLQALPQ